MTEHLVGVAEIAGMLGVSRSRVTQLVGSYADFPAPDAELASGRIWNRTAVEQWIRSHPSRPGGRRAEGKQPPNNSYFALMTDAARLVAVHSQEIARLLGHPRIGCEHVLLGLARETGGAARGALERCRLDEAILTRSVTKTVPARKTPSTGHLPFTPAAKKSLEKAYEHMLTRDDEMIDTEHVLLGLLTVPGNLALRILQEHLDDPLDALTAAIDAQIDGRPAPAPVAANPAVSAGTSLVL
ncbi:MAG TPA: Clp protease N-terminal domain-containing protein, partial [Mycobacteriales bacterium]|nr:Clp protease N-terminal domain-containing protein [Mycobacteriales bacterium]